MSNIDPTTPPDQPPARKPGVYHQLGSKAKRAARVKRYPHQRESFKRFYGHEPEETQ